MSTIRVRELEDEGHEWRYRAVFRLVDDLPDRGPGQRGKWAGSLVAAQRTVTTANGDEFQFTDFDTVALSLSIAISADQRAKELQAVLVPTEFQTETGPYKTVPEHEVGDLFDFLEQVMIAVTFSYQGLESYCNSAIEDRLGG